ncbi:hypothetical protein HYU18_01050 [Candidatus Woesearchaeota archaeon]|nr:hypothetical protein [Candidatus Woesearchaeota archaeon]
MAAGGKAVGEFIRRNLKRIAVALGFLLLFSLVFNVSIKAVVLIPLLILVASFSTFYFNYVTVPVNFELVKLFTVLVSAAYGFLPGLSVGVASTFFGKVLIGRIDDKLPLSMLVIAATALAASLVVTPGNVATAGIAIIIAYNVAMLTISQLLGGDLAWNIPYEGTNLLFNVFLFAKVAPWLLDVLA